MEKCPCDSGKMPRPLYDAAGIFCGFVCDKCEERRRSYFNPEIFRPGTRYSVTGREEDIDAQ